MVGHMDIPVHAATGLILNSAADPTGLMKAWMSAAKQGVDAHRTAMDKEALGVLGMELEEELGEVGVESLEIHEVAESEGEEENLACVNAMVGEGAVVRQTLYVPVRFSTDPTNTWWAMVDTGAQISIISSGLVEHLRLLNSEGVKAYPPAFTVSGFTGGDRLSMPILEVFLRFGTRGGDERWERV